MYRLFLKNIFDWIVAFLGLVILSPVFLIAAFAIKIDSKGPILFKQERLGKDGKVFLIYKFRSMFINQSQKNIKTLHENDPRITNVGRFIRKTSIDELPQLINIIKGEMSFIGPRPPLTYYPKRFEEYSNFEKKRFHVKPGISGLAAIRCREIHDWNTNIPIDVEYTKKYSFLYDLKLFMMSLLSFFRTDNIYTKNQDA